MKKLLILLFTFGSTQIAHSAEICKIPNKYQEWGKNGYLPAKNLHDAPQTIICNLKSLAHEWKREITIDCDNGIYYQRDSHFPGYNPVSAYFTNGNWGTEGKSIVFKDLSGNSEVNLALFKESSIISMNDYRAILHMGENGDELGYCNVTRLAE